MEDTHFSTCLMYISISHLLDAILGSGNDMWKKMALPSWDLHSGGKGQAVTQ